MSCEIGLADKYTLRGVNAIEIKKSVHQIVQTAKVVLPLSLVMRNNELLERISLIDKIKEGDKISLAFGYKGNNLKEFTGYIRNINYKQPVELECEDDMYLFRKTMVQLSFKSSSLTDVLKALIEAVYKAKGVRFKLVDNLPQVTITNLVINNQTALWALQSILDRYPLLSIYLVQEKGVQKLYCGLLYGKNTGTVKYGLNRNTVSVDDLKYKKDTTPTKVILETTDAHGKIVKQVFGDVHADNVVKKKLPGVVSESLKKAFAQQAIQQQTYEGYRGNFKTFLKPYMEPGMAAAISDSQFVGREGNYYVGTVTTTFSVSDGGRRQIDIEFKMS